MIRLKKPRDIAAIRQSGVILAAALDAVGRAAAPGVTTLELDAIAEAAIRDRGGVPAFKGYRVDSVRQPFPGSICASINDEVVHGIPDGRRLRDGDILSVDCGVESGGFFADAARTIAIGNTSRRAEALIETCREALKRGIDAARGGRTVRDIGEAVQTHVEGRGASVVRALVGHGTGFKLHEEPQVPNYVSGAGPGAKLRPGMVLAIEPMINGGGFQVRTQPNGWTVVTEDGSLSAHFEHTIAVTDGEAQILTLSQDG